MNTVWVLEHEHKHGTEISVHRRREGAEQAAADILRVLVSEAAIEELLRLDDAAVLAEWKRCWAGCHGTYFRIREVPVHD